MNITNDFTTELEDVQYSPAYVTDLERKIKILEAKNAELNQNKLECEKLFLELRRMTSLKESFEEKYNEASMKLLYMDDDESFMFNEAEQIRNLNQKLSILVHANQDLQEEVHELKDWNQRIIDENSLLKEKIIKKELKNKETNTDGIVCENFENLQIFNVRRSECLNRGFLAERLERTERFERIEGNEKNEKLEKNERNERNERNEKGNRSENIVRDFNSRKTSEHLLKTVQVGSSLKFISKASPSPFSRNVTPKLESQNKKRPPSINSRGSPKVGQVRKSKSVYKPSFLRKSFKSS
jgi:hypothetical protein